MPPPAPQGLTSSVSSPAHAFGNVFGSGRNTSATAGRANSNFSQMSDGLIEELLSGLDVSEDIKPPSRNMM